MALPDPGLWPSAVEWRPRRSRFSESLHDDVRATKMEAGNTHREALDSDEVVRCQVLWRFTPVEWSEVMRGFFRDHRATGWNGWWVDAGGAIRWGLITVDGPAPQASPAGAMIDVAAALEIIADEAWP